MEAINDDVTEMTPVEAEERKRPHRQKAAKETMKRVGGQACIEALDKMWTNNEVFDREKEKNKEERYLVALEIEKKCLALDEKGEIKIIRKRREGYVNGLDDTVSCATVVLQAYAG